MHAERLRALSEFCGIQGQVVRVSGRVGSLKEIRFSKEVITAQTNVTSNKTTALQESTKGSLIPFQGVKNTLDEA